MRPRIASAHAPQDMERTRELSETDRRRQPDCGAAALHPAAAADISGAGATFPYPIYAKWADAYKKETGNGLNYQSIGSGGGIKQIKAKTVTFGATDAPLTGKDLDKTGLVQFPMVMGGIVPVVNLDGIKPGELVSTARRSPTSSSARSRTGTTRRSRSSTRASSCRTRRSRSCIARTARARPSTSPTISSDVSAGLEVEGRRQHRGRVAGRHRRQGQRRRRQQRRATPRARSATSNTPTPSRTS